MPRYYFDCHDGTNWHPDAFGIELDDDEIADQASEVMLELLREQVGKSSSAKVFVIVRNAQGAQVYVAQSNYHATILINALAA